MKKGTLYKIITTAALGAALLIVVRENAAAQEAGLPPGYRLRNFNVSAPLSPKPAKEKPRVSITLTLLEVQEPAGDAEFFYDLLYSGSSPEQYRNALLREYQDMVSENQPDDRPSALFQWEHSEIMAARRLRVRGMALERELYVFTGGAHGMQSKTYYVIDLEQHKALEMGDFFRDPREAALRALVKDELRRRDGLAKNAPLSAGAYFEDEPEMSSNFFITPAGLGLRWDPYEIAPYSEGGIEIILPWKSVRPLLKHEAIELLAEFGIYLFVS